MNLLRLTVLILLLCSGSIAQAQSNETKSAPLTVQLNVTVTDAAGKPVADLTKDRFRVFEDDAPQTISIFEQKARPLVFGIAVDASGSMRSQLKLVVGAGKRLISELKPEESAFVMRFIGNKQIELIQELTSNKRSLERALDSVYVEGGLSAIIDAIFEANKYLTEETKVERGARRGLVLITDGEDRNSFYKPEQLFAELRESGLQVFVIALTKDLGRSRDRAENLLRQLALVTGGDIYDPESAAEFELATRTIMIELRSQYVIGYESTSSARNRKLRKLRVEVLDQTPEQRLKVSVRPSFIP